MIPIWTPVASCSAALAIFASSSTVPVAVEGQQSGTGECGTGREAGSAGGQRRVDPTVEPAAGASPFGGCRQETTPRGCDRRRIVDRQIKRNRFVLVGGHRRYMPLGERSGDRDAPLERHGEHETAGVVGVFTDQIDPARGERLERIHHATTWVAGPTTVGGPGRAGARPICGIDRIVGRDQNEGVTADCQDPHSHRQQSRVGGAQPAGGVG